MKKFLLIGCLGLLGCGISYGAPLVTEAPILGVGTPITIAVSSTTLTMVPSSQASGRLGVFVDISSTNTARVSGFFGNCTSTSLSNTIRPIEIAPSSNSTYFPIREDVCMWLLSLDSTLSTLAVHYQEVKQ